MESTYKEPQLERIDSMEYILKKSGIDGLTQKVVLMHYFPDHFIYGGPKIRKKEAELAKDGKKVRAILGDMKPLF
ncbi:MAG: hypothetical protein JRN26_00945 [Nitrososphaerota archaeon]|jgi:hypothetical protein|nr:hypothetical protein [Nitrososphaerota archaeon]MDG6930734.1 hypothetical protein [Nitrososphaerota archaeon]MDG6931830.1 hypothetical protein [Nitrososphaerota archaeon]MDG6935446.1 hypothetical protein [Nitrososphaerota archaeon]MDG6944336.1 hypothetical protein [Nitrososphaerota archaeon]